MLEMAAKCSNYAKNSGLCFPFWIILFEADYARNYASILYQCLPVMTLCISWLHSDPLQAVSFAVKCTFREFFSSGFVLEHLYIYTVSSPGSEKVSL